MDSLHSTNRKLRFYIVSPAYTSSFGHGELLPNESYVKQLKEHAEFADKHSFYGMVFYCFNSAIDPWVSASYVLNNTEYLSPLIAVQPYHYHPHVLVKKIASMTYMYGRRVDLNIVSGFSKKELVNIGDELDDPSVTRRLSEYLSVTSKLLRGEGNFLGEFYKIKDMPVTPAIPAELMPNMLVPGGSHKAVAKIIGEQADASLLMARPLAEMQKDLANISGERKEMRHGMIIGIVAREDSSSAWEYAQNEYAGNRKDKIAARMMVSSTRSAQHKYLVKAADKQEVYDDCLWYGGSRIGIDCPKLVGSYQEVREALDKYLKLGVTDIIVDLPSHIEEYDHVLKVLEY